MNVWMFNSCHSYANRHESEHAGARVHLRVTTQWTKNFNIWKKWKIIILCTCK